MDRSRISGLCSERRHQHGTRLTIIQEVSALLGHVFLQKPHSGRPLPDLDDPLLSAVYGLEHAFEPLLLSGVELDRLVRQFNRRTSEDGGLLMASEGDSPVVLELFLEDMRADRGLDVDYCV